MSEVTGKRRIGQILERGGIAVLAPVSGGCSQYLLSATVEFRPASKPDEVLILNPAQAPHHQALLDQSTLSLRVTLSSEPDGTETAQLVLTGNFSADRSLNPAARWRPFRITRAHLADASGKVESVHWPILE